MVRPLPSVDSTIALRDFVLSQPADSDGWRKAYCILRNYQVETSEGNVTPLVTIAILDNAISMYIQCCDIVDPNGYLMDATDVTTSILCDDIPCATGTAVLEDVIDNIREVVDGMASDGYVVDEILGDERGYRPDARVDVIVDI